MPTPENTPDNEHPHTIRDELSAFEDLELLVTGGSERQPVVVDRRGTPWILFCNDDGDTFAATVPCPDLGIPSYIDLAALSPTAARCGPCTSVTAPSRSGRTEHRPR